MDVPLDTSKKVMRIRTFKDDVARLESQDGVTKPEETAPLQTVVTPPPAPKEVSTQLPKQNPITVLKANPVPPKAAYQPPPLTKPISKALTQEDITKVASMQKTSILSDEGAFHSEHSLGEGMIVRDTKRKRFQLLPAMAHSVQGWFTELQAEYKEAIHGKQHTVAKAESRLETIRKAIEQGRQAPKDDFKQVATTLKATPRAPISTTVLVKEKTELPAPAWSHVVGEPDVPPIPTAPQPTPIEKSVPQVAPIEPQVVKAQPVPPVVSSTPAPVPAISVPVKVPQEEPRYVSPKVPSERPYYLIFAGVIFVATMLGVGVSYYFFGRADTGVIVKEEVRFEIPKLFVSNSTESIPLTVERVALLETLEASVLKHEVEVVHIYPAFEDGTPADLESILATLGFRIGGASIRNIREMAFGGAYGEPFIVLNTTSFDTAFAGLLAWEESMSADLAPLFGTPVFESFNPEIRTNTQTSPAYFKDIIASNKNARLLVDENGDDRIVYTFVDQSTIVITTTREALANILENIR